MPDILIRDVSEEAIALIDANARAAGLSRNEYLRRKLDGETDNRAGVTVDDLKRAAHTFRDATDPEIMAGAWE